MTVLLNRAEVLTAIGRDDEAYRDYTTVISLDSTLTEPRYMHAIMSLRRGDFNTSLADCKALEQMSPASEEANTAFGSYYSATEQWDKALPYYTALLEKQPTTHIYGARAVCYLMLQRGLGRTPVGLVKRRQSQTVLAEVILYYAEIG